MPLGDIIVASQRLDVSSPDGLDLGNGLRLEPIFNRFQFALHVIPASWQNFENHYDINADGQLTPVDVLLLINEINLNGSRPLERPSILTSLPAPYLDPTGDSFLAPVDVLVVINEINRRLEGMAEAERSETATPLAPSGAEGAPLASLAASHLDVRHSQPAQTRRTRLVRPQHSAESTMARLHPAWRAGDELPGDRLSRERRHLMDSSDYAVDRALDEIEPLLDDLVTELLQTTRPASGWDELARSDSL